MIRLGYLIMILFLAFQTVGKSYAAQPTQPNILFIYIDDLGYEALNCYGGLDFATPNLDRMAQDGEPLPPANRIAGRECQPGPPVAEHQLPRLVQCQASVEFLSRVCRICGASLLADVCGTVEALPA